MLVVAIIPAGAQVFRFPTANTSLFEKDGGAKCFVGTTGKPWESGTFGCVRSGKNQMHEGLDIRSVQRDQKGEPMDAVMATADGSVAYINRKPQLSNYGNYIILRHSIEGLEVYSVYAHLSQIRSGLKVGEAVKGGDPIAVMGRTSNTHEQISKERAHVHFEINLMVNDNFSRWYKKNNPKQRDDHGPWNGQNLLGLDPQLILRLQKTQGERFSLLRFVQSQTELCRVFVRATSFPWMKRYTALMRQRNPAESGSIVGYEIALNFNGLPFQLIPRTAAEIKGREKVQLLSVNANEAEANPCRHLVTRRGKAWELTTNAQNLLGLLIF
ncbi:MAG: Peptidase [Verrucomicrobiales bacterium]|nr:Peptidase [Verrucomicrobiales bacterium]